MDKIRIRGGRPLSGTIAIGGAKNAALPLMAASLLTDETLVLENLPNLADTVTMRLLLEQHGVTVEIADGAARLAARRIASTTAPYDIVRKMRASVLVLGPLVARCGVARVSLPGGCGIGTRPVDLHIKGLERLGATVELSEGYIEASAPGGLVGNEVVFPLVSVGATENLVMAACLAKGETLLVNAAREPEVTDLVKCLIAMGADIEGIGTDRLRIKGKPGLHGATHPILPDRIETGTYAMAAAITGGDIELQGADHEAIAAVVRTLEGAGIEMSPSETGLRVRRRNGPVISAIICA
jgi:UDP-N-acetylglucosamine 1-carboxyvinyltransferase